jgi:RNA polymerase sigma-70 factor (ECF subfamily)
MLGPPQIRFTFAIRGPLALTSLDSVRSPAAHGLPALDLDHADRDTTERAWCDAVRTGDLAAFEAIFRAYATRLAGFAWSYLLVQEESEEVVQDLFAWIWEHRFDWEVPGPLRTYLFRSTANRALSRIRHRRVEKNFQDRVARETGGLEPRDPHSPADACAERELAWALERAIKALPDRCRTVFLMNRQQHMSYSEIAGVLGISPRTVEVHMSRALAALRSHLADWTDR